MRRDLGDRGTTHGTDDAGADGTASAEDPGGLNFGTQECGGKIPEFSGGSHVAILQTPTLLAPISLPRSSRLIEIAGQMND
jgi:hypothetical protein